MEAEDSRKLQFRDALIALSLANLFFYKIWSELFYQPSASEAFFVKAPPETSDFIALFLNVLLLATGFWIAAFLTRRSKNTLAMSFAHLAFLVTLLIPLAGIYSKHGGMTATQAEVFVKNEWILVFFAMLATLVLAPLALIRKRFFIAGCRLLLLALAPFVLVTFGHGLWCAFSAASPPPSMDKALAPRHSSSSAKHPRVLILIFDEFDFRLAFSERPPSLDLPVLDHLRDEALFATNAFPPSNSTIISFPAIIQGRLITKAQAISPNEVMIHYDGQDKEVPWSEEPNLFSEAYGMGINTAMVGWYLAYGRVLGNNLTFFSWEPHVFQRDGRPRNLVERMLNQYAKLSPIWRRKQHATTYRLIRNDSYQLATDHDIGLTLIHVPIPHAPHIFNRHARRISEFASPIEGYIDNLALVDRYLGGLRQAMKKSGTWDKTAIIISGDHSWRYSKNYDGREDPRVPFLLKLPGQTKPLLYAKEFNNVLIHDLSLSILRGELATADQAADWIEKHRSVGLSPYSGREKR